MGTYRSIRREKNRHGCLHEIRPPVEDLIVNSTEHKILDKFRKLLEERFNVLIRMPKPKSLISEYIFVSIQGDESNRNNVKKFLAEKMNALTSTSSSDKDDILLITLSDSESDIESSRESEDIAVVDLSSEDIPKSFIKLNVKESNDKSDSIVEIPTSSSNVLTITNSGCAQLKGRKRGWEKIKNMMVRCKNKSSSEDRASTSSEDGASTSSEDEASTSCKVSSTTDDNTVSKKAKLEESVILTEDFIPLPSGSKSINEKNQHTNRNLFINKSKNSDEINNDDIIIIDEPEVVRRRRPIVIDGSNVAMEHGKVKGKKTFSVKGIKIAIDYFVNLGHEQVTAFVPKFRRNCNPKRSVPTIDGEIFDELERQQQVVFTPSRWVSGKCITSYDDRFIVNLAVANKGIIVSNDNYRDLIDEKEEFKEAIEQRLLMFCFVGDKFMIPDDPLGRDGPTLEEFLCFPLEEK